MFPITAVTDYHKQVAKTMQIYRLIVLWSEVQPGAHWV